MENSRDKYYTELVSTITDCNDRNSAPLSNDNIRDEIHRSISEEEVDAYNMTPGAHNVTVNTFSQTPDTQRENENTTLTSEKQEATEQLA